MSNASAIEISPRQIYRLGDSYYRGIRNIICYAVDTNYYMQAAWNEVFPDLGGLPGTPICRWIRATTNPSGMQGLAHLTLRYTTPREAKRARLLIGVYGSTKNASLAADNSMIQGWDPTEKGTLWVLQDGVGNLASKCLLRVETADYVENFNVNKVMSLYGFTNDAYLPNIGNPAPGTLRFLKCNSNWRWGDELIYLNYTFAYDPNGWMVTCQDGSWVVQQVPIYDKNDQATGCYRQVMQFRFAKDAGGSLENTTTQTKKMFAQKSFSDLLAGLTFWGGGGGNIPSRVASYGR